MFFAIFASRGKTALEWICRNQLNKHNLNDEQITYIAGEMYKARKKSVGEHKGNQYGKMECAQNGPIPKAPNRTAEAIAKELACHQNDDKQIRGSGTFGRTSQLDQNDPNGIKPKSTAEVLAHEEI